MNQIRSDVEKNRLYIKLEKENEEGIRDLIKDITHNVSLLKKGFTCLVDIRNMSIKYTEKEMFTMEIVMGGLIDAGMGRVVRVVSKRNKLSQLKMEKGSRALGYRARPAASVEEAERILDEEIEREQQEQD